MIDKITKIAIELVGLVLLLMAAFIIGFFYGYAA